MLDSANGNNSREDDRRVLLLRAILTGVLRRAGLSRVILTGVLRRRRAGLSRVILTGVLGLPRVILTGEVLSDGVLDSVVLAGWVLAAAAFVRSLILISDWAHRSTDTRHSTIHSTTHHSTIHHIRGR